MTESKKTEISKQLSYVLRHKPDSIGLELESEGWADVQFLLQKLARNGKKVDLEELEEVVHTNSKKRFAFNEDHTKIRASQGHSVAVDLELLPQVPPAILYHGTIEKFLPAILETGLLRMQRQHVHLSLDVETARTVAQRRGKAIILNIESRLMHDQGFAFFLSENGVWLTEEVPPHFITIEAV